MRDKFSAEAATFKCNLKLEEYSLHVVTDFEVLAGAGACPLKSEIPSVQASTVSGMFSAAFTGHGAAPSNWIAVYSLHCLVSALWPLSIQTP